MKKILGFLLYFLIWLVYFELARVLFFIFNTNDKGFEGFGQLINAAIHGFLLDLSAVSYLVIFPFLFLSSTFIWPKISSKFLSVYHITILIITTLIVVTDNILYQEWGYKIEMDVFQFLKQPQGALQSISIFKLLGLLALIMVMVGLFYWLFRKLSEFAFKTNKKSIPLALLGVLLTTALIVPLRGGIGNTPLSIASAYHSNNAFSNHLAYNTI